MLRFLKYWLWDIDEPPSRIGFIGGIILAVFTLFCIVMWVSHGRP